MLPFSVTRGHVAKLKVKNVPVEFVRFDGGHEVPKTVKDQAFAFLRKSQLVAAGPATDRPGSN